MNSKKASIAPTIPPEVTQILCVIEIDKLSHYLVGQLAKTSNVISGTYISYESCYSRYASSCCLDLFDPQLYHSWIR